MKTEYKSNKRKPHNPNRIAAIKSTALKFSCTESYVRSIIAGNVTYGNYEAILKNFNQVYKKIEAVTNQN